MQIILIIGQILLGGYFVYSGLNHILGIKMLSGYAKSKGVYAPHLAVGFTGLMLLVGGLSILFGFHMRIGIIILVIFMLGVTFVMHAFWTEKDSALRMNDEINFSKNVAILGALLILFVK